MFSANNLVDDFDLQMTLTSKTWIL